MTVLLDSDVLIEVSRGQYKRLLEQWSVPRGADVVLCSRVTIAELWHGARPGEHKMLSDLFAVLVCVPVDQEIGWRAGDYLRQAHKSHSVELGTL